MKKLEKLLDISSTPSSRLTPVINNELKKGGILVDELLELLNFKNGFYTFENALHVFGTGSDTKEPDLRTWNEQSTWRNEYDTLANDCIFFAEDIFGVQFCIFDDNIYIFDPETGDKSLFANNIEEWANLILENYKR